MPRDKAHISGARPAISPPAGPGIWLMLLAGLLALAAVVWPPRRDVVPPAEEPTAPPTDAGWFGDGSGKTD